VFEPEGDEDELSLFTSSQTETYKDVKVNPELTEEQRGEVMKVLEKFQDVFTDVPGLTNLGKHAVVMFITLLVVRSLDLLADRH